VFLCVRTGGEGGSFVVVFLVILVDFVVWGRFWVPLAAEDDGGVRRVVAGVGGV